VKEEEEKRILLFICQNYMHTVVCSCTIIRTASFFMMEYRINTEEREKESLIQYIHISSKLLLFPIAHRDTLVDGYV